MSVSKLATVCTYYYSFDPRGHGLNVRGGDSDDCVLMLHGWSFVGGGTELFKWLNDCDIWTSVNQ